MNQNRDITVVLVWVELNQAARSDDHLIAMKNRSIVAQGMASEIVTRAMVEDVFGLRAHVGLDPVSGSRW